MKIEYKDADGRLLKLEVSDEVGQFYLSSVQDRVHPQVHQLVHYGIFIHGGIPPFLGDAY